MSFPSILVHFMITYAPLIKLYPLSWKSKTTETSTSASYIDLLFSVTDGTLLTKLYDKHDYFEFRIINFPYNCSLWCLHLGTTQIRHIGSLLFVWWFYRQREATKKLVDQGYTLEKSTSRKFYGRYNDIVQYSPFAVFEWPSPLFVCVSYSMSNVWYIIH